MPLSCISGLASFLPGDLLTPLVADPLVPAGMCVEDDLY